MSSRIRSAQAGSAAQSTTQKLRQVRTQGEVIALTFAAVAVGAIGLYFARSVVGPLFFAASLVITMRPLTTWLIAHRIPKTVAAIISLSVIYSIVGGMFVALGISLTQLAEILPTYTAQFTSMVDQARSLLDKVGVTPSTITGFIHTFDLSKVVSIAQSVLGQVSGFGTVLLYLLLSLAFVAVDMSSTRIRGEALSRLKPNLASSLVDFASAMRSYWVVSTVFGLIVAVLDTFALGVLGVPLALTWGILSFITNYIPNVGFVIGLIPPAILALVASGPWTALWVVVAYVVLNFLIQSVIQPKFTGDAVGLNTTVTFISLLLWSTVIGALGTILAVPLTLFVKALLIDSDPRSRWLSIFLSAGDQPVIDPDEIDFDVVDVVHQVESSSQEAQKPMTDEAQISS